MFIGVEIVMFLLLHVTFRRFVHALETSIFGKFQRAAKGAADRISWTQVLPASSKMCGSLENEDLQ